MTQIKKFFLNGKPYYINQHINLFQLLTYFNYNESLLVLEHNNLICNQKKWQQIFLKDQDKIEIVTIVGGG